MCRTRVPLAGPVPYAKPTPTGGVTAPLVYVPAGTALTDPSLKGKIDRYGISPLVIHSSYLVNLASATSEFHRKSVEAFRGELQRALALCADYLVLHPGSFRGRSREEGLELVAKSIAEAAEGLGRRQDAHHGGDPHRSPGQDRELHVRQAVSPANYFRATSTREG